MWTIRSEQMEAFRRYTRNCFEDRIVARWGETARRLVRPATEQARSYGITAALDVERYLGYMMVLGEDFDRNPATAWAAEILRDPSRSGEAKMQRLDAAYPFSGRR